MIFNDSTTQIDDLLDKIAEGIQLDATRRTRMEAAYNAVNDWLNADEGFFKKYPFEVYPQGSVSIGTPIKPLAKDEFDLDTVIHINVAMQMFTPQQIFNELKRRLSENGKYKGMIELKNRCIRLNYAGDFHMDILIGVQESPSDSNKIKVPDRKLNAWTSSNPKGYTTWFMNKANTVRQSVLEKAYAAKDLPTDSFKTKKPLQRAVQLIKRYRDEYFKGSEYATSSIILTTIAGQFYDSEDSIFNTIDNIINRILAATRAVNGPIQVLNPVNSQENFTDKWAEDARYYDEFLKFANHLNTEWKALKGGTRGRINEDKIIMGLFGEDAFNKGMNLQNSMLQTLRDSQRLQVDRKSGILTSGLALGASTVKSNTFYGSDGDAEA